MADLSVIVPERASFEQGCSYDNEVGKAKEAPPTIARATPFVVRGTGRPASP